MGYILIDPEKAREKGLEYFETLPDGRAVLDFSYLKVLGSMGQVEVVGSASELNALIDGQKKSGLYDGPEETQCEDKPIEENNVIGGMEEPAGDATVVIPEDTSDSGIITEKGGEK